VNEQSTPYELWQQAEGDPVRYRELMIEHGHLIPGKPEPLPCGWSPTTRTTDHPNAATPTGEQQT
jgi:hypothetical protein